MKNYDDEFLTLFRKNKRGILFFVGFVLVTIATLMIIVLCLPDNRKITHESAFSGVVTKINEYKGSLTIRLKDGVNKYYLKDANNYELSPVELMNFLQLGDSVYKPLNSDSLFIYREDKQFLFILGNLTLNKTTQ